MQRVWLSTTEWSAEGFAARTFTDRLLGLRRTPPGTALVIHTRSVHTFGLAGPIEIVAIDGEMTVVETRALRPNRVALIRAARTIVELPGGAPVPRVADRMELHHD